MATLEQMMTALRNADAQGNTQDAQRLASLIQQTRNPVDNSLLTGMQDRLYRAAQGVADLPATITRGLTGLKDPRLFVPKTDDGSIDFRNIRFMEAADVPETASNPFGFQGDEFDNAVQSITKARADLNYAPNVTWEDVKSKPNLSNVAGFMGEQAITSLPDMALVMLSTPAYFSSYVAPIANERAKNNGNDIPTAEDLAYAATTAAGIAAAERFGAKGIFGNPTGNIVTRPLKSGVKEAGTEAIQNPLEYAGGTVGTETGFSPDVALDQAAAGAVGGFGAGSGIRTSLDVTTGAGRAAVNLVSGRDTKPSDTGAAADLAKDLQRIADAAGHDLMDVDPSSATGAKQAVMDVHAEYAETLKSLAADIKEILGYKDNDTESQRLDKILAKTALRKGRNVAKNMVNKDDFEAISRLAGKTKEGQELINMLKRSNELTRVNDAGFKGGISRITDVFNPFDMNQGYSPARNTVSAMSGLLTGGAAISTQGLSLVPQAAAVGAGRAIDALTGRRSKVARFIEQNAQNQGLEASKAPSLRLENEKLKLLQERAENTQSVLDRARKAIADAQRKAANRALGQRGAAATPNSPQDTMEQATGLDKNGVARILRQLERIESNPAILKALEEYRTSVDTGGTISEDMLSPLIRAVNAITDAYPNNQRLRVKAPVRNNNEATTETQLEARKEQGKRDNAQRIKILKEALEADNSVNDADRAVIDKALEVLGLNLGENPVETAEAILDEAYARARNKDKVSQYVLPYVERVRQQQTGKKSKAALTEETNASQLPFKPFLTEELMGRPLDEREKQFNELDEGVYGLRNQLERMQMRAGEGILSNRDKSSDIGDMQIDFDPRKVSEYRKSIIEKAVESLDPEGRKLMSELQVGLKGDGGLTNEQIAILVPSVVRALEFMSGAQASSRGAYGRYVKILSSGGNFVRNRIEVADLGEIVEGFEKSKMHSERFLNTLLHEVGHAIGDRSNLDQLVKDTILLGKLDPDESYYNMMEQLTKVSKMQRRELWDSLDDTITALQQKTGYYLGSALTSYQLKLDRDGDVEELTHQVQQRAMAEGQILELDKIPRVMHGLASQIRYLNDPKELVADAVSYYLQKPKRMKELYPDLAKIIRKGVNESSLQQFITFHSLAGLIGVAGLQAVLMAMANDEEDKGVLSLGQGALSSAA